MPSPSLNVDLLPFQLDILGCRGLIPSTACLCGEVCSIRGVVGGVELSLLLASIWSPVVVFARASWISAQWCAVAGFSFPLGGVYPGANVGSMRL
jgi:hypothetical protein